MAATKIQVRRDDASTWSSINPVLNEGEFGLDLTSMKLKIGDGVNNWNQLLYVDDDGPTLSNGSVEPSSPVHGDIWVDTSECPPTLLVYTDPARCPSDGGWNQVGGGGDLVAVTISPLNVTPQPQDTTELTVTPVGITSILPDSLITYVWYQYDLINGGSGTQLRTVVSDSAISDTYTPVGADMGKFIGCTVSYLGTVISESARATIGTANVPVANMHGLRFDNARGTYLSRENEQSNTNKFTFSCWLKPTEKISDCGIFSTESAASDSGCFRLQYMDDGLRIAAFSGSDKLSTSIPLTLNEWCHVVAAYDDGSATLWVNNGGDDGSKSITLSSLTDPAMERILVGAIVNGAGAALPVNGYLSDAYLVDGQALEPTTFGQEFTLGWGPLDSSQVITNIGEAQLSPYDQRPNMSQEWSANTDGYSPVTPGSSTNTGSLAFDGDISIAADAVNYPGQSKATFTSAVSASKVEVYIPASAIYFGAEYYVYKDDGNKVTYIISAADNGGGWIEIYSDTTINVVGVGSKRRSDSSGSQQGGWRLDGRILVDGPANNSQNWSTNGSGNTAPNEGIDLMFDGNEATTCQAADSGGNTIYPVTFDPPIGNGTTDVVEVLWYRAGDVSRSPQINGVDVNPTSGVYFNAGSQITSIGLCHNAGKGANGVRAIKLNGVILIDAGYQWNTSQVWSQAVVGAQTADVRFTATQMFDGELGGTNNNGVLVSDTGTQAIWTTTAFPDAKNVRIYYYASYPDANGLQVNGNNITVENNINTSVLVDVDGVGLNSVSSNCTAGAWASTYVCIKGVEVDGILLVDPGSFGDNGFHLPFDPEAEGVNYSSEWPKLFNGIKVTDSASEAGVYFVGLSSTKSFDNLVNIEPTSTIQIYGYALLDGTISINDESAIALAVTISPGQTNVGYSQEISYSGEITKLTFASKSDGTANLGVSEIVVDGKTLINHNNIGVDASGNDNNFHDDNFNVGKTSEVWSHYVTGTPYDAGYKPQFAFNNDNYGGALPAAGSSFTWKPPTIKVKQVKVVVAVSGTSSKITLNRGESDQHEVTVSTLPGSVDSEATLYSGSEIDLKNITWDCAAGDDYVIMKQIFLNGILYVDGNIQDTVIDTPMNSHSVLETLFKLKNGGLRLQASGDPTDDASAGSVIPIDSGKYYWEAISDSATTNGGSCIHTGITTSRYGSNGSVEGFHLESDGTLYANGSIVDYVEKANVAGDVIGVAYDKDDESIEFFVNNEYIGQSLDTSLYDGLRTYASTYRIGTPWPTLNFGQQNFAGTNVFDNGDGTVTIDSTVPMTSQVYSDNLSASDGFLDSNLNAFTGDFGTRASNNEVATGNLTYTGTLEIRSRIEILTGLGNTVFIDGLTIGPAGTDPDWVRLVGARTISGFVINTAAGGRADLYAVRIDGRILVDGNPTENRDEVWSAGGTQTNGDATRPITNLFDGNTSTLIATGTNGANDENICTFASVTAQSKIEIFTGSGGFTSGPWTILNNGTEVGKIDPEGSTVQNNWYEVPGVTYPAVFNQLSVTRSSPDAFGSGCAGIKVDGKILVDADGYSGGTYKKLQQTWTEQQAASFKLAVNRLGNLESAIRSVAAAYVNSGSFDTGAFVSHNGEIWQALVDNAESTEPSVSEAATWKRLDLTV